VLASAAFVSVAAAQPYTQRSFLVPERHVEITGTPARPEVAWVALSQGIAGDFAGLSPHLYWGATERVTLGITHRGGLCLRGCDLPPFTRRYDDVGFALLAGIKKSRTFELDLHLELQARKLGPFLLGLQAGVLGRITFGGGPVALVFDPSVYVGLTHRDGVELVYWQSNVLPIQEGRPPLFQNRDESVLPFWFYFQASDVVVPFVGAAFDGDPWITLNYAALDAGVLFELARDVDLGAVFRVYEVRFEDPDFDDRSAGLLARFRL